MPKQFQYQGNVTDEQTDSPILLKGAFCLKALIVLTLIILATIISFVVGEYNSKLGEILGMAMIQPLLLSFLFVIFLVLYIGLRKIFTKEKKEKEKFNENEISNNVCVNSDIYLVKTNSDRDLIEYQFMNKENSTLWNGRCNLIQGKIHSIMLYSGDTNMGIVLQVLQEIVGQEYLIKDSHSIIGKIKITNKGLSFSNLNHKVTHTAILETVIDEGFGAVADWLLALDTLHAYSSSIKYSYFILNGENGVTSGKYYITLQNIDLTPDINNNFDRRIASVFSMLIDCNIESSPSKNQEPDLQFNS